MMNFSSKKWEKDWEDISRERGAGSREESSQGLSLRGGDCKCKEEV